jgi:molybdopterin converting factor small subunit
MTHSIRASTSTDPRVTVSVPGPLRELTGGESEVRVAAAAVGPALDELLALHPGLRRHLRAEDGRLREHVNVFRNQEDVRYLDGEATRLDDGDELLIVPSIAGG